MQTFPKKKVEIIVEVALARRMQETIEALGAKGYTVFPNLRGKGRWGERAKTGVFGVFENVMIVVITGPETAAKILEAARDLTREGIGIAYVSDVDVLRDEHF